MEHAFTNRLIQETSPYLLQHAHNPVDWFPWGDEAFAKARAENKPILLSVGYSACHWCHVMEHESFEDEKIAGLMNNLFVSIKVDREERPDVDEIYMNAVQMLTGRGGWPMTVFMTPDGKPFYGGTYFPPVDRHNLPAFPRILAGVAQAYRERPHEVEHATAQILGNLEKLSHREATATPLQVEALANAAANLAQHVDHTHGGLGGAPKFPNSLVFSLFLRQHHASGNDHYLQMTVHTLRKMAEGGMYDHLGGGFHRYSVDERWLVPHFEKMLYDNALLTKLYLEAYQATGEPFFRQVAEEILAYVEREMLHPDGGFYSTQDADSEGEEGKFFTWSHDEVMRELGEEVGALFSRYYEVTDVGNFEHSNILHPTVTIAQLAKLFRREEAEVARSIADAKRHLFAVRERRVKPGRDEKILTSWNGLTIAAFAEAYKVLGNSLYLDIARQSAEFVLTHLTRDGRLLRSYKDGQAKFNAYLDDYALFTAALIDLYEATFDRQYLDRAVAFTETLIERFWDATEGGFFFTSSDHEALITRSKSAFDGSVPSGNSVAVFNLLRLSYLTENSGYLAKAEQVLRLFYDAMEQNPFGFSHMLGALDFYLRRPKEIVLLGQPDARETREILARIHGLFLPNKTLACFDLGRRTAQQLPSLLFGKQQIDHQLTVYVCHNFTCSLPVTEWGELKELLSA
ncbi:MAG: thioredoxin domain-containing protein [Deltaproteobacteria bacterium]|nr:thioredoxin domain-containing protein [Deltaproteobacteria bacterium]